MLMTATKDRTVAHYRTVPIVVSGATFSVRIKWFGADIEGFDVDEIQPIAGQTFDDQGYTMEDVREAIEEKCIDMLDEIVASGFDQEVW